ncbi:DUF2142 domain-containing protein [Acidovorax sp. Root217]|uniref:DUF2142 domain-containing protein n=1 Tax=Acidovorax sp. Root217 TaxID=1736492 RepID=UPI00070E244E|nr:DUF2142 domain-containing protein [Acidovorax sp. Root217]KRC25135.1 hypothetical protein ASE31_19570 [Acidovorax sp. Root217]
MAWLALAFAIACGMMQLIPAFQSPDEIVHLLRADMVAHGQPLLKGLEPDVRGKTGGWVDIHFFLFSQWMQKIVGPHRDRSLSPAWLTSEAKRFDWLDDEVFVDASATGYYAPFIYLPHALGLKLSRALDLSLGHSYQLTRMLVTLLVLGVVFWAWQTGPPSVLLQALLLMPMALFQIISPTIDGLCFALALLVLSLFLLQWQEGRATRWQAFAFYFSIFLLVTSRTNLIPMVLLPLVLLLRHWSWQRVAATATLFAASSGWTLYGLVHTQDHRVVRALSTGQIIGTYLRDPLDFLRLVGRTIADPFQGHLIASSFVGNLGWADAPIADLALVTIGCGLLLAAGLTVAATSYQKADLGIRATLLVAAVGSALLAFFALAVTWNDYPVRVIEGLQGRYFIIPSMLLAAALGPVRLAPAHTPRPASHRVFVLLYAMFCLGAMATTLQGRYGMGLAVFDF